MLQPAAAGPPWGYGGMGVCSTADAPPEPLRTKLAGRRGGGHDKSIIHMPAPSIAKLVAIGTLRRLSWAGEPEAACRTTHDFTLGQRLAQITAYTEPMNRYAARCPLRGALTVTYHIW